MYRQTYGMPAAEQQTMREYIKVYTEAVVGDEWKLQLTGGASPTARTQVANIYKAFAAMSPAEASSSINQAFLANMSSVASDRNKRTLASAESIPDILILGLVVGGIVVVGMSFLLYMDMIWPHVVLSSVMAILIGVLLFITLVLNRPFGGQLGLDPGPFEHSLSVYQVVDQG